MKFGAVLNMVRTIMTLYWIICLNIFYKLFTIPNVITGNKRLDEAYKERESCKGSLYLLFSVNGSGHFCGNLNQAQLRI